jgi:hypothetical protein
VLTNWCHCRGTPTLVTTTSVSFYFIVLFCFNSPDDSMGYRDKSTRELTHEDHPVLIPSEGLVSSLKKP